MNLLSASKEYKYRPHAAYYLMLSVCVLILVAAMPVSAFSFVAAEDGKSSGPTALLQRLIKSDTGNSSVSTVREQGNSLRFKEDELIIRTRKGINISRANVIHARTGGIVVRTYRKFSELSVVKIPKGKSLDEMMSAYRSDPDVLYAEPNYIFEALAVPNDSSFSRLWGLHNTGQTGGVADADIDAPEAWGITTGSPDTIVAVIDTGVDYNHQDLSGNMWVNPGEIAGNGIDDDGNGYIDDVHGINAITGTGNPMDDNNHGTHVSGTIAGTGNNNLGIAGVNWSAKIIACKFLNNAGSGYASDAVECLDYLYDLKTRQNNPVNIVVSNNSWGGGEYSQSLRDSIDAQREILFIAAAGNNGTDNNKYPFYPAGYNLPSVIAVAAFNASDLKSSFSNYGNRTVHVAAPGENIYSLIINNGYASFSGTSMAAPHVAGLAGLLKAQDPSRNWKDIKNLILAGGINTSAMNGNTITGKRINAYGSLTCTNSPVFAILDLPVSPVAGAANTLSALSINCNTPVGPVTVAPGGGGTIQLLDDGVAPDQAAGDGVFTGTWIPSYSTVETLVFTSPIASKTVSSPPVIISDSVSVNPPASIVDTAITSAPTGMTFSQTFFASGGIQPVTWSVLSGSLPNGLILNPATGEISGTSSQGGINTFTVQVTDGIGMTDTKTWTIFTNKGLREGWPKELQKRVGSGWLSASFSPVFADLDGDGKDEIIVADVNTLYVFDENGLVAKTVLPGTISTPVVADIDNDGTKEILAGVGAYYSSTNSIYAFRRDLTPLPGFPAGAYPSYSGGPGWVKSLVSVDLNSDGKLEIIAVCYVNNINDANFEKNAILIVDSQGTMLAGWPKFVDGAGWDDNSPAVADIDNDGISEVIFVGFDGNIHIFRSNGVEVIQWQFVQNPNKIWPPVIADINGDGFLEIIIKSQTTTVPGYQTITKIHVHDRTGTALPGWPRDFAGSPPNGLAMADLDGDARADIIFVSGVWWDQLQALRSDGTSLQGWPVTISSADRSPIFDSNPVAADINGDGTPEVIINVVDSRNNGKLLGYSAAGTLVPGYPKYTTPGNDIRSTAAMGDIDNNGRMDIVTKSEDGMLYVWEEDQTFTAGVSGWPMFRHDPKHTGTYLTEHLIADAGPDQFVLPGAGVTLDGSKSRSGSGTITSWQWIQTGGTPVVLTNADTKTPGFIAPATYETLTFQLTITADSNKTATDTVNVIVNQPPVANAGPDQTVAAGSDVTLAGAESYDPNGSIVSYSWTQTGGTTVNISGANTATPNFTAPATSETLTFQLTVTDNSGQSASDTVSIVIKRPPVAEAGPVQWVLPGASATLNGAGSYDPDGTIASYSWTQTVGPVVVLSGADTSMPTFITPNENVILLFYLTVTDNDGLTSTDFVYVSVNTPPVASAGPDLTVVANSSITLNGTDSSDPDGTIQTYSWTQTAGTAVTLTGFNSATPVFTTPNKGDTLTFNLTVIDNSGQSSSDTVNIIILPPVSGATLTANLASPQVMGSHVTFTAGGSGGTGDYEYQFLLLNSGVTTTVQAYSLSNTWTWNTATYIPTQYSVIVYVRNAGSVAGYEVQQTLSYTITETSLLGNITTIAGGGAGDGGQAAQAIVYGPYSVTRDSTGNLYIAERDRIRKVDVSTGLITTVAGNGSRGYTGDNGPAVSARLNLPYGVAVDSNGNVYIADTYNNRIRKVDASTGIITTVAGNGMPGYSGDNGPATAARVDTPDGIAIDEANNIYVVDGYYHRIRKIDAATGIISTVAGNGSCVFAGDGGAATSASLCSPRGVAVDTEGNIFIADTSNWRIRKVDSASGIITTYAGNGAAGYSGDNGPAANASFRAIYGIFIDLSGNLYVADTGNYVIRKINASGTVTTVAGGYYNPNSLGDNGPATSAYLASPTGVVVDAAANMFIADYGHNRIRKVDRSTGIITTFAGNGTNAYAGEDIIATSASLNRPTNIALDISGNIYIADSYNARVRKLDGTTGKITTIAGTGNSGYSGDNGPATAADISLTGIAVDKQANIYISGGNRIRKVDAGSGLITTIASNNVNVNGVYGGDMIIDATGNIYLAEYSYHVVKKIDAISGTVSVVAGNGNSGSSGDNGPAIAAAVGYPSGLALDYDGNLFIASTWNHRIRRVDLATGVITTFAGSGYPGFAGDYGPATSAQLYSPIAIAFDSAGNLYISDQSNGRIRFVDKNTGVIRTVAGNGGFGFSGDDGPALSAAFYNVSGIAVDAIGNVYIADTYNDRIRKALRCDSTATSFTFEDQVNVDLDNLVTSNSITVSGMESSVLASISGGEYEINENGLWLDTPSTVNNGDTVRVRVRSSSNYSTSTSATLMVSGVSNTFSVTTIASGDMNGDGIVDVSDALKLLRIAAGIDAATSEDMIHGDVAPLVDGKPRPNGKIDLGDVVVTLRKAVELVTW